MTKAECQLWGESFSPNLLRTISNISLSNAIERGESGRLGRYKNKPTPYGTCHLCVPDGVAADPIEWLADFVIEHKGEFERVGATNIVFWIVWFGNQGNMELSVSQLSKLSAMQIPVSMDYVFVEDAAE